MRYINVMRGGKATIIATKPSEAANTISGYGSLKAAITAWGAYGKAVALPSGEKIVPSEVNYPHDTISLTAGCTGRKEADIMYTVNYHAGAGNTTSATLDEAMAAADKGACYTQEPITIENADGETVARRSWWGCMDGVEECEAPIRYGNYGYYGDWEIDQ